MPVITRYRLLVAIAIVFHLIGLIGIGLFHSDTIVATTPFHLLLMLVLLFITTANDVRFMLWAAITFIMGYAVEWIGVHTGWLFGDYVYGDVLGVKWNGIPILIGVNWILVMAGAVTIAERLFHHKILTPVTAATIAAAYDWLLEPVAVQLNFWQWQDGVIPFYNYLCWWVISLLIAILWQVLRVKPNQFSIALFITQVLFFIALRLLL